MATKVYVASSFLNKEAVREAEKTLRDNGFEVTSRWVNHTGAEDNCLELQREGLVDLHDLLEANIVIALWPGRLGTASEIGVAIGSGIPVCIINSSGKPINMPFAYLPRYVRHLKSIEEFLEMEAGVFFSWQINE
jgi:nucleoside 2-deoxyribosyltransferase